ncbi:MAG: hypothetical protein BWX55_00042 [Deltaproteobacteria bacterium ADurb.Bin022]|nr:MAG: hypothetical protein BWX55_00042 [Deltaproteobacteria bacterium ADurb.Bin022]
MKHFKTLTVLSFIFIEIKKQLFCLPVNRVLTKLILNPPINKVMINSFPCNVDLGMNGCINSLKNRPTSNILFLPFINS